MTENKNSIEHDTTCDKCKWYGLFEEDIPYRKRYTITIGGLIKEIGICPICKEQIIKNEE